MPRVALYNIQGQQVGEVDLDDSVFGGEVNEAVLHDAVVMQLASRRRGTAATRGWADVSGGGRKPWRQKGTGRARAGSIRSPLWRGGAVIFGPQPRDYGYRLPKKVRRLALRSALASKVRDGNIIVLDELKMEKPRTKDMAHILKNLNAENKALVVTATREPNVELSARNLPGVRFLTSDGINVYDLLAHDKLVITKDAVARVQEVLA
ncbi:50S ribosomal protein L4 [Neomoorella thermoacetica]|uniref:Large ribosomal subunit protein uL4 n=2 Tax=Neomoorella thermoacetica TaxID=1525 RepID=RL4_MOOTA|nr:50S ribosomal protein L4 [Moorella thermoacetica]Q2RFP8.1 RecName: Full=Large ribosomal subunit protein uL4; AltName: Full=50S ribosomal protein L4 [Moorella thermoacetica ATCC 39073]AKX95319.1 50S ribosomal protein L4 [Moorella thermoacetica]AKX97944.1 50S ribosomal protein L4 [Moorella thermoacetica]AOQ25433.1 50S ribosomal protein L4 [Moorella thermoacetica]OIQ10123.1 50S ribosomal protein L4 [Moorella thermoacetica]OIQ12139.1 50S ribosomal protein L4 [Moorella thermoacetica]